MRLAFATTGRRRPRSFGPKDRGRRAFEDRLGSGE